jgi:hypothetical protein
MGIKPQDKSIEAFGKMLGMNESAIAMATIIAPSTKMISGLLDFVALKLELFEFVMVSSLRRYCPNQVPGFSSKNYLSHLDVALWAPLETVLSY